MSHVWMAVFANGAAKVKIKAFEELIVKQKRCLIIDPCKEEIKLKLLWLPIPLPDSEIKKVLEPFGTVKDIKRERWRFSDLEETETLTRVVTLVLKEHLTVDKPVKAVSGERFLNATGVNISTPHTPSKTPRKTPRDDLAPPNRPAQVNAREHRRQVAMVSCARRQSERRIGAANAPWTPAIRDVFRLPRLRWHHCPPRLTGDTTAKDVWPTECVTRVARRSTTWTSPESQQLDGSGGIQLRWTVTLGVKSPRPEKGKRGETHPKDPSAGGGCKTKGSSGDAGEPRLHKGDPSPGLSGGSPGSGQPSKQREQERRPHKVSVLGTGPNASDGGRHRGFDDGMSSQQQLSSRPKKKKRDNIHPKDSPTNSGCETKGSSRDADGTRLDEGITGQSHSETSSPSQMNTECSPRSKRPKKKRLHGVSELQSSPDSFNRQRHKRPKGHKKLSSGLGDGNRDDIHPTKVTTDSGWRSKKHSSDAMVQHLNKQGGLRQRRSRRRRWVFRSGSNASDRDRRLSARSSRKFSSGLRKSKSQGTCPKEQSISGGASNRPGGNSGERTQDGETSKQSLSDERHKSCKESSIVKKPGDKPPNSPLASAARREQFLDPVLAYVTRQVPHTRPSPKKARVDPGLDFSRQPSRETASFKGPVWTAPPQDTLPGGGRAVAKGPRRRPCSSKPTGTGKHSRKKTNRKTPVAGNGGDRFIPNHHRTQFELANYVLTKKENTSDYGENAAYRAAFEVQLNADLANFRIMSYTNKAPDPPEGHGYAHFKVAVRRDLNVIDWSSKNQLAVCLKGQLYLWNASSGSVDQLLELQAPDGYLCSVSWSADGSYLAIGTSENQTFRTLGTGRILDCSAAAYIRDLSTLASRRCLIPLHLSSMRRGVKVGEEEWQILCADIGRPE
ncbi:hypothetical protein HPB47_001556 [Ixodes persulcatus]|uniref:Uncharacterized protein n=1 Tax=Ixodes persulcatus TaxID=34615 RepID=A0AC60PNP8_IXOPE|nr:hypothetical protein HPB47_001556 [Ixodes persulcatus]